MLAKLARFKLRQIVRGQHISDMPVFTEPETGKAFARLLSNAETYLEYGSGGSTVSAARLGKKFVSVESDRRFMAAVQEKIGHYPAGKLLYANTGVTGPYGVPVFTEPTERRRRSWQNYATMPWGHMSDPDLILIDGRFRVLCALVSIQKMTGKDFTILIDDYTTRPHFHEVEQFARLADTFGEMAMFKPKQFNASAMACAITRYSTDFS